MDNFFRNVFHMEPVYRPINTNSIDRFLLRFYHPGYRDTFAAYTSAKPVIWSIIGLNSAVFFAWQYSISQRDTRLIDKLQKNFSLSVQGLKEGRYWTVLTSAFSHQWLPHFFFNMFTFHTFATLAAMRGVGALPLSALCIGSALAGSLSFAYHLQSQNSGKPTSLRSGLGASGMVMGVGAVATCLAPFAPMQIMFIPINIPLWMITVGYALVDTYYLHSESPVGHSAHLGGSVFGVAFYFARLRGLGGISNMLRMSGRR